MLVEVSLISGVLSLWKVVRKTSSRVGVFLGSVCFSCILYVVCLECLVLLRRRSVVVGSWFVCGCGVCAGLFIPPLAEEG